MHCDGNCMLSGSSFGPQLLLWDLGQREIVKSMPMAHQPQACVLNDDMTCYSGSNCNSVNFWYRNDNNDYVDRLLKTKIPSVWGLEGTDQYLLICGSSPCVDIF